MCCAWADGSGSVTMPDRFSRSAVTTQAVAGLLGDGDSSNDDQSQKPDRRRKALLLFFLAPAYAS